MSFILKKDSLLILGRRGDTGNIKFTFAQNLTPFCVHFYVKKNINDSDEKIIIKKEFKNVNSNSINVILTQFDTDKLIAPNCSYGTYYWGLKIHQGHDFVKTIIPQDFKTPPMMYVYPSIGGVC